MRGRALALTVLALGLGALIAAAAFLLLKKPSKEACAAEAQAAVEAYLREGRDPAFGWLGEFKKMTGGGYHNPVWNIQGYDYITLERHARFTSNTIPLRIYVTEGETGQKGIGKPRVEGPVTPLQGARIFVSHPGL